MPYIYRPPAMDLSCLNFAGSLTSDSRTCHLCCLPIRFGESAGEATEDVLATAGHCMSCAWNVFKIRKAINPATSVSAGVLKNAGKARNRSSYS